MPGGEERGYGLVCHPPETLDLLDVAISPGEGAPGDRVGEHDGAGNRRSPAGCLESWDVERGGVRAALFRVPPRQGGWGDGSVSEGRVGSRDPAGSVLSSTCGARIVPRGRGPPGWSRLPCGAAGGRRGGRPPRERDRRGSAPLAVYPAQARSRNRESSHVQA